MVKKVHDRTKMAATFPPSRPSEFGRMLFEGWVEHLETLERRSKAADTLMRASDAGRCLRELFFKIDDEEGDEPGPANRWRMELGTMTHNLIEQEMVPKIAVPGWTVTAEPKFDLSEQGVSLSGHGDLLLEHREEGRVVLEIKTVNGTKMKNRAFDWNGGPAGPEAYHLRQVGLAAQAFDATAVVILYVALENMGPQQLRNAEKAFGVVMEEWDKFIAEWVYDRADLQPMIDEELRRMRLVTQAHERGLSAGDIPKVVIVDGPKPGGRMVTIVDQDNGTWELADEEGRIVEIGDTWACRYCSYRGVCKDADG